MDLNHPRVHTQEFSSVPRNKNQDPLELVKLCDPNVKNALWAFNFSKPASNFYLEDMSSIVNVPILRSTNLIHHKE